MTNTANLERRLETWIRFLGSELAVDTPAASLVLADGTALVDDLQAVLDYLRKD